MRPYHFFTDEPVTDPLFKQNQNLQVGNTMMTKVPRINRPVQRTPKKEENSHSKLTLHGQAATSDLVTGPSFAHQENQAAQGVQQDQRSPENQPCAAWPCSPYPRQPGREQYPSSLPPPSLPPAPIMVNRNPGNGWDTTVPLALINARRTSITSSD